MSSANRVLIVDDEAKIRRILGRLLSEEGYTVRAAETAEQGLALAPAFQPDVVIMDQNLPGMSGQEATEQLVERVPGVKVIMITAYGAIDRAVDAMRRGAYDYVAKPFDNDALLLRVDRAMEARRLTAEVAHLREALGGRYSFGAILGESPVLQGAVQRAKRAAQLDVPVLIEGESGTGKELLVRAIHHASRRSTGPFVAVNCAAVPRELVESEFFGHEAGAFTGAGVAHQGRFERANGGTLFLDEISEMPVDLQAKLLRALEEGEVNRIGGNAPIAVDVRVVAATNRVAAVAEGVLRADLYHRLAVVTVHIPPVRERAEDIPLLAQHFLILARDEIGTGAREFSGEALEKLRVYGWPGNVRELRNAVQSAAVMAEETVIRVCDLPTSVQAVGGGVDDPAGDSDRLADAVARIERQTIARVLAEESGNKSRAAARLGITRKTLSAKMLQFGL